MASAGHFRLFSLPQKIRGLIYEFALNEEEDAFMVSTRELDGRTPLRKVQSNGISLALACKATHHESRGKLGKAGSYNFHCPNSRFNEFIQNLDPAEAKAIRRVSFQVWHTKLKPDPSVEEEAIEMVFRWTSASEFTASFFSYYYVTYHIMEALTCGNSPDGPIMQHFFLVTPKAKSWTRPLNLEEPSTCRSLDLCDQGRMVLLFPKCDCRLFDQAPQRYEYPDMTRESAAFSWDKLRRMWSWTCRERSGLSSDWVNVIRCNSPFHGKLHTAVGMSYGMRNDRICVEQIGFEIWIAERGGNNENIPSWVTAPLYAPDEFL